jgi:hypothetical protein
MGLFGKKKERCGACGKPFESHDECEEHITNIHPETKPCTKCSGTAYYSYKSVSQEIQYICVRCGFVVETWKTDNWTNNLWQEKDHSKPAWK